MKVCLPDYSDKKCREAKDKIAISFLPTQFIHVGMESSLVGCPASTLFLHDSFGGILFFEIFWPKILFVVTICPQRTLGQYLT